MNNELTMTPGAGKDYRDDSLSRHTRLEERDLLEDTAQHFDECHRDYLFAWCNSDNLAFHYGFWDVDKRYDHHQALLNKNQIMYERGGITASDYVLDAGCGVGGSSMWMAENYANRAVGISITKSQVVFANKHAKKRKINHLVDFKQADFCQTNFEDETFDVVWAAESVCHTPDKGEFLKEAYRVLRPGGRLVFCDAFMVQKSFNVKQWHALKEMFNGWAVPNLSYVDEFEQLLKENQFQNIKSENIHRQTRQSCEYMYRMAKRLYPIQKISQFLGLRTKAQTANYLAGVAQYEIFEQHYAEHFIFTATK